MRINVPSNASTQLFATGGVALGVRISNEGAVPVWLSDQQILLDGAVDPFTNLPGQGETLSPKGVPGNPSVIEFVIINSMRWARAQFAGAVLEVFTYPITERKGPCACGHS